MKAAAIQMVSGTTLKDNLERAHALLTQAAQEGVDLAVLPEYFCLLGRRDSDKLAIQEPLGIGPIQDFLAATARELGLWLVGGTLPLSPAQQSDARVYNSTLVYSPQGLRVARYDKIHLFRFDNGRENYDETRVLRAGERPTIVDIQTRDGQRWRLGLSVCYDLRFPELYRAYAQSSIDMLLVPSAFTYTTGQAHWEVLLRARAIENQVFVIAAAQGGVHENGRQTWGHSMLVDPWGRVLAQKEQGEGVVTADLSLDLLRQCRAQLPALEHRTL